MISTPRHPVKSRLTLAEFIVFQTLPENADKWVELIDGELYIDGAPFTGEMSHNMPTGQHLHSWVISRLLELLVLFVSPRGLGRVYPDGTGYDLPSGDSLIPDLSFVQANRIPDFSGRMTIAPDLAIEVVSPSNSEIEMRRKVRIYLNNGVRRVWLVYPDIQTVGVYQKTPDGSVSYRELTDADTLTGEDILPDFTTPVRELFPKG